MTNESVCVVDFCGREAGTSLQVSFSADYFPQEQRLYFTGDWGTEIPSMPAETIPTKYEAYMWARSFGGIR